MNIRESAPVNALRRTYYKLKNWEQTKDDMRTKKILRRYKNRHKGEVCVVIGNGPSLRVEDLTMLHELSIPTLACNRIHLIFEKTPWRPTYYFMSDEKLVAQYEDDVPDVTPDRRFFPRRYRGKINNGVFYKELPFDYEKEGQFSLDASEGVCGGGSVTTEMLQFAYYLGFSEIYMIGVDFSYNVTTQVDSKTYSYQGENNYFIPGYLKPGEVADMPNIAANLLAFHAAREAVEGQDRVIKNATRGGKLEVFERQDLDELFAKWRATK